MSVVNFGKDVRNKFHAHDTDQILIVTAGRGYVATEKEKQEVSVGDVIVFPAGEKHWHGAAPGHGQKAARLADIVGQKPDEGRGIDGLGQLRLVIGEIAGPEAAPVGLVGGCDRTDGKVGRGHVVLLASFPKT